MEEIKILNSKDVAKLLGVSVETVNRKLFTRSDFPKIKGIKKNLVEYNSFIKFITNEEYQIK